MSPRPAHEIVAWLCAALLLAACSSSTTRGEQASCTGIRCDAGFPVDTGPDGATADDGTADSSVVRRGTQTPPRLFDRSG